MTHDDYIEFLGEFSRTRKEQERAKVRAQDGLYQFFKDPTRPPVLRKNGKWYRQHHSKNKWERIDGIGGSGLQWIRHDYPSEAYIERSMQSGSMERIGSVEDYSTPIPTERTASHSYPAGQVVLKVSKGKYSWQLSAFRSLQDSMGLTEDMIAEEPHTTREWVFVLKPEYVVSRVGLLRKKRIVKR